MTEQTQESGYWQMVRVTQEQLNGEANKLVNTI